MGPRLADPYAAASIKLEPGSILLCCQTLHFSFVGHGTLHFNIVALANLASNMVAKANLASNIVVLTNLA